MTCLGILVTCATCQDAQTRFCLIETECGLGLLLDDTVHSAHQFTCRPPKTHETILKRGFIQRNI